MLAAAIGIDRTVEADVGRFIAGDDLARRVGLYRGPEGRQLLQALPAVVEGDAGDRFIAAGRVGQRPASAPPLPADAGVEQAGGVRLARVICRLRGGCRLR